MYEHHHELARAVQSQMPDRRWRHTLGVMDTAVLLAGRFGVDPVRAELAALLHDVAKYWPVERQRQVLIEAQEQAQEQEPWLNYDKPLWHAPAGAIVAARDYGIQDTEVLDAIRYHTSGRPGMTLLDKVICLADYMEPDRDFPGVENIRALAAHSLEKALIAGFDSTIVYLISQRAVIFPLTISARNSLLEEDGRHMGDQ